MTLFNKPVIILAIIETWRKSRHIIWKWREKIGNVTDWKEKFVITNPCTEVCILVYVFCGHWYAILPIRHMAHVLYWQFVRRDCKFWHILLRKYRYVYKKIMERFVKCFEISKKRTSEYINWIFQNTMITSVKDYW